MIGYEAEKNALKMVSSGKVFAALMVPKVTKEEVVAAGLSGDVFNHKTTRHVIPARPLFIDVPLEFLRGPNLEEANKILVKRLSKKRVELLPPVKFWIAFMRKSFMSSSSFGVTSAQFQIQAP